MKDGLLNKCKECTKRDVRLSYESKSQNEFWCESERIRGREKYKRLGYKSKNFKKTRSICPYHGNVNKYLKRRGYNTEGKEAHHWNYNRPRSVILLSKKAHHRIHTMIDVDYTDKYCYTKDGIRIETEEQAISIFSQILLSFDINENLEIINF